MIDEYDLERFIKAHQNAYLIALKEIKNGKKQSHWMWYIFPQLADLGHSPVAKYYGIRNKEEAIDYLNNDLLKNHLIEISEALLKIDDDINNILGYPDNLKLRSCMTLFHEIDPSIDIFMKVIKKFYNGELDRNTINLL